MMAERKTAKSKKTVKEDSHTRIKAVPEYKLKTVSELSRKMKESVTVLLASTRGLPSSQFHDIKKNLRGKSDICVAKKSLVLRALSATEKGGLQNLKEHVGADIALFFSNLDAFELSGLLSDNQSPKSKGRRHCTRGYQCRTWPNKSRSRPGNLRIIRSRP